MSSMSIARAAAVMMVSSCATTNYMLDELKADTEKVFVTAPAGEALRSYADSVAEQWDRVNNVARQRAISLAREIDRRDSGLTARKSVFLIIGGLAGVATTIYAGIESNPRKEVVIPLSAVAGTALLTAIPALGQDERLNQLREKKGRLASLESEALSVYNRLDQALVEMANIQNEIATTRQPVAGAGAGAEREAREAGLVSKEQEARRSADAILVELRNVLLKWQQEAN